MRDLPDDLRPSAPTAFDGLGRALLMVFVVGNLTFWALVLAAVLR